MRVNLVVLILLSFFELRAQDKGIGVLFFTQSIPTLNNPHSDSIVIYQEDKLSSSIVDTIRFDPENRSALLYEIATDDGNTVEFEYETLGIPIEAVLSDRRWIKVKYARNKEAGFVRMDSTKLSYFFWKDLLIKKPLFFSSIGDIAFFNAPNGNKQKVSLKPSDSQGLDYIMHPIDVKDNWLKVKVTAPSDYCFEPKRHKTGIYWIKFLDNRGRPLVWYFVRGC